MLKVIRQNTEIMDCDNACIYKVVSVGDCRYYPRTHCFKCDFDGEVMDYDVKLSNIEIENIVFKNYNARAVFRPEEDERKKYTILVKDVDIFNWKHGYNLCELVDNLACKLLFDNDLVAMIRSNYLTKEGEWVTAYETPWIGKDYVQEIDDFYSDPRHGCYTLGECIEELEKTTSWI